MVVFWDFLVEAQLQGLATIHTQAIWQCSVEIKNTCWSIMPGALTLGVRQGNLRPTLKQANESEPKIHMESYFVEVDNVGLK